MWLLPSRNRPSSCRNTLAAFAALGTTPGVLWVDDAPDGYADIALPAGWSVEYASAHGRHGIAESMRWLYEAYPGRAWYGWIADDMTPVTPDFDRELIETAAGKYFVYCSGDKHKTPATWRTPKAGHPGAPATIPSAMLWGGDLVRSVGWWVPPWSVQTCIDEAWKQIALKAGLARYRHDVIVRHLHWMTGGRPKDETDQYGMQAARGDIGRLRGWLESAEFGRIVRRVQWEMR